MASQISNERTGLILEFGSAGRQVLDFCVQPSAADQWAFHS